MDASAVSTKLDGPPRCHQCDRMLKAMSEGRFYCPCCGEIYRMVEKLVGTDVPNDHGWVRTGYGRGRTDSHEHLLGPACDDAVQHRLDRLATQQQFDLAPEGTRR